jgi:hypothetical protein
MGFCIRNIGSFNFWYFYLDTAKKIFINANELILSNHTVRRKNAPVAAKKSSPCIVIMAQNNRFLIRTH